LLACPPESIVDRPKWKWLYPRSHARFRRLQ
jgi:hypothetical protein